MRWDLAGQILTVWGIIAFLAAPLIGSYLRKRRVQAELQEILRRSEQARVEDLRLKLGVAESHLDRQRFAREAGIPITENQWLQRAREAEALFPDERTA